MDVNPSSPPRPRSRPTRFAVAVAATVTVLLTIVVAGPASAGGWAVTELDEFPKPAAGETIEVGFTIRQHGVTPVDLDRDVGIELTAPDGTTTSFAAVQSGPTGHYVAEVTFGDAGTYTWTVRQGWFAPQELGPISVTPSTAPVSTAVSAASASASADAGIVADQHRFGILVRFGLPAMAALLALGAATDVLVSRRRLHATRRPAAA